MIDDWSKVCWAVKLNTVERVVIRCQDTIYAGAEWILRLKILLWRRKKNSDHAEFFKSWAFLLIFSNKAALEIIDVIFFFFWGGGGDLHFKSENQMKI